MNRGLLAGLCLAVLLFAASAVTLGWPLLLWETLPGLPLGNLIAAAGIIAAPVAALLLSRPGDRLRPLIWIALFFAAAGISFALSVWLWFSGDRERGLFVGLWVPSILAAGGLLLTGGRHD